MTRAITFGLITYFETQVGESRRNGAVYLMINVSFCQLKVGHKGDWNEKI